MSSRFIITYWIYADNLAQANLRAEAIALEQTLEIPRDIVPSGYIEDVLLGHVESVIETIFPLKGYRAEISYSDEIHNGDFIQALNVIFGNSSIQTNIKVLDIALSDGFKTLCSGPKFGVKGLRQKANITSGPLLMSALKPIGLTTKALADIAYQFALGGLDFVKDDHGLADQKNAPFADRLKACVDAISNANAKTGGNCTYVPNITTSARHIFDRAFLAQSEGAGAVMLAPALVGMDVAKALADDPNFHLPIITHPTFSGTNIITHTTGFTHRVYFGLLQRLMGADAVVYPNFGGRFGFSIPDCQSIASGCSEDFGNTNTIMPTPGGGMSIEKVAKMKEVYGDNVMYLIGGALLSAEEGITKATENLVAAVRS